LPPQVSLSRSGISAGIGHTKPLFTRAPLPAPPSTPPVPPRATGSYPPAARRLPRRATATGHPGGQSGCPPAGERQRLRGRDRLRHGLPRLPGCRGCHVHAALVRLDLLLSIDEITKPRMCSESRCIIGKLSKKAVVRDREQVAVAHDIAQQWQRHRALHQACGADR
jgi:hypothetical protein